MSAPWATSGSGATTNRTPRGVPVKQNSVPVAANRSASPSRCAWVVWANLESGMRAGTARSSTYGLSRS